MLQQLRAMGTLDKVSRSLNPAGRRKIEYETMEVDGGGALRRRSFMRLFAVPAFAYADGGEGEDYGDPTMTEETTAPEPTIEPGEGFSEEGNLVTRDLLYDEHTNKQFITVQTAAATPFTLSLTMTSLWTRRASSMKPTF